MQRHLNCQDIIRQGRSRRAKGPCLTGSTGTVAGKQVTFSPAATTPNACTNYLQIVVPVGRQRRIAVTLNTVNGATRNRLTLRCTVFP